MRHPRRLVPFTAALFAGLGLTLGLPVSAAGAACGPDALGVSRIIEIDTGPGGRYGHLQYKENELLRDREVVLTFDDGPLPAYTRPVLDALDKECAKATFFVVGRMAKAYPDMVKEMALRGHTVGGHTWSHKNLKTLSAARAKAEIERGFSAIREALGQPVAPFFRFPYLSDPRSMIDYLQDRRTAIFSIDVDSYDYKSKDPGRAHRNVMRQLADKGRGIILFHDIQPATARAMPALLRELKAKGYKVVHLRAKSGLQTLAEYDSEASQAAKTKLASRHHPLAARSLTHPLEKPQPSSTFVPQAAAKTAPAGNEAPATAARQRPNGQPNQAPRQVQQASGPPPAPPAPPALRPTLPADDDWRVRVFRTY